MLSLTARLLISLSFILACFLGATGYILNKTFKESSMNATHYHLLDTAMSLIATAEVEASGRVYIPDYIPMPRLNQLNSGLYAQIINSSGKIIWRSDSAAELMLPPVDHINNTKDDFSIVTLSSGEEMFNYRYGVTWELNNDLDVYTINFLESLDSYKNEIKHFQQQLWVSLGGFSLLLMAIQGTLMRWSLRPLRTAAKEIEKIETGQQSALNNNYPKELQTLTQNINGLIKSNKQHLSRYRHAVSDLAHSLKTPLALLRSASESNDPNQPLEKVVSEQVDQMRKIVDYQLQRASTSGQTPLSKPIIINRIANKINDSLTKVYADKFITSTVVMEPDLLFFGDESDFFELLGNIMDNAYKWANSKVQLTIVDNKKNSSHLLITIEDDGPGIESNLIEKVLERGIRSDERSGSGIGLAIVNDIVQAYNGSISLQQSYLGGCKFTITLTQNQ